MKKKILWITSESFLDTDIYIVPLLANNFSIDWFIIKNEHKDLEFRQELQSLKETKDIHVNILQIGDRERDSKTLLSYTKFFHTARRKHYDLTYTCLLASPYFMGLLAIYMPLNKIVLGIHNVHVPVGGSHYHFNKVNAKYAFYMFRNFHTFSLSQYQLLRQIVPNKNILYAPFLLKDYGKPTRKRQNSSITFLNFGNIRPYKRIDILIDAAQKAYNETRISFKVIIAGNCGDWHSYERLIKEPQLFDIRLGRVKNEEVPNLFEEADYFVAPYQDIAQSGSVVVALNYKKPVIASRLSAFTEYIEDGGNGFLIEPANRDDLYKVFVNVLKHHTKIYPKLTLGQEIMVEKQFSAEIIKNKYEDFFNDIIDRK